MLRHKRMGTNSIDCRITIRRWVPGSVNAVWENEKHDSRKPPGIRLKVISSHSHPVEIEKNSNFLFSWLVFRNIKFARTIWNIWNALLASPLAISGLDNRILMHKKCQPLLGRVRYRKLSTSAWHSRHSTLCTGRRCTGANGRIPAA